MQSLPSSAARLRSLLRCHENGNPLLVLESLAQLAEPEAVLPFGGDDELAHGRAFRRICLARYANCANYPPVLKACEMYFNLAVIWVLPGDVLHRVAITAIMRFAAARSSSSACTRAWATSAGSLVFDQLQEFIAAAVEQLERCLAVSLFENLDRLVVQLAGDEVQASEFSYLREELTTVRFGFDFHPPSIRDGRIAHWLDVGPGWGVHQPPTSVCRGVSRRWLTA